MLWRELQTQQHTAQCLSIAQHPAVCFYGSQTAVAPCSFRHRLPAGKRASHCVLGYIVGSAPQPL